ncbi:hypothetical protein M422DRAFT_242100 [Sphaerobolus stellatus SS14]|nr:hypothetical protein M422DRAFT_242100 [Sphaerobolus stellatus SS14]
MDNEQNAQMQVDPSTNPMSAIQAFKMDPSTELAEKDVSHTVTEAWPELVSYQDNYYRLLEDYNVLKESNLSDQVQSLEKELQEAKDNSVELSHNEELILENKRLKKELEYYIGRAQYALHGKDTAWAEKNGYHLSDIPASMEKTMRKNLLYIPIIPPNRYACTTSKTLQNNSKVVREAGIPAIGGYRPPPKQKRIIADPPASITGPAFRGASEWILEQDVHDAEMRRLYAEAKALQPHQQSPDHTAVMFRINEYTRSLPGLPRNLVVHHDDPDWMTEVIQSFNSNPSGVP